MWLALQDIGVNDRIIVLKEILRETLVRAREHEATEPQTRKATQWSQPQEIGQLIEPSRSQGRICANLREIGSPLRAHIKPNG